MLAILAMLAVAIESQPAGPRRAMSERPWQELFTGEDYPVRPRRQGIEGTVGFRVEIDSRGKVTSCTIVATSSDSDLDGRTCAVMLERARFRPALDSEGRPVPDSVTASVTWRLADAHPDLPFAQDQEVTTLRWSDPDPICTETWNGHSIGRIGAAECIDRFGPALAAVRDGRGAFELSLVSALTPLPVRGVDRDPPGLGERVWFDAVEIGIAPDGKIRSCRSTASHVTPAAPAPFTGAANMCSHWLAGAQFEPAPDSTGIRRLRAAHSLFLKRGAE